MRKLTTVLAGTTLLFPLSTLAVGMGDARVKSFLTQPLEAEIPLVSISPAERESLAVRLADEAAFSRVGLNRAPVQGVLRFVVVDGKGGPRIRVTTERPVTDPILSFLVELRWEGGSITREFTLLLDPPLFKPTPAPVPVKPVTAPVPRQTVQTEAPVRASVAPSQTPETTEAPRGRVEDGVYGPVAASETLWSIAERTRPGTGITNQQMMLALLEANPGAFANGNINSLRTGAKLRIPSAEQIRKVSVTEAYDKAQAQNKNWREPAKRQEGGETRLTVVESTQQTQEAGQWLLPTSGSAAQTTSGVSGAPSAAGTSPASGASAAGEPNAELVSLREQLAASGVEKEQLTQRIDTLESQLEKARQLIALKDELVGKLEQQVREAKESKPATSAQPAVTAPVAAPPPEEASSGLFSPLYLLGGGGLIALLVGAGLYTRSRKKKAGTETSPFEQASGLRVPESLLPRVGAATAATAAAGAVGAADKEPSVTPASVFEPNEPETAFHAPEPTAPVEEPKSEVASLLEEIEVMMAYGLHDKAATYLRDALASHPEDPDLLARQVRLLHETGDHQGFLNALNAFHGKFGNDDPRVAELMELALDVDYSAAAPATETAPEAPAPSAVSTAPETASVRSETFDIKDLGDLSFDLPTAPSSSEAAQNSLDELAALDFPTAPDFPSTPAPEVPAVPVHEPVAVLEANEALDIDFGLPATTEAPVISSGMELHDGGEFAPLSLDFGHAEATAEPASASALSAADAEEIDTKIDLAQAFIDMGDHDSARVMLEEVLADGSEAQKARAQELLVNLG